MLLNCFANLVDARARVVRENFGKSKGVDFYRVVLLERFGWSCAGVLNLRIFVVSKTVGCARCIRHLYRPANVVL